MRDDRLGNTACLVENLFMLAQGYVSDSFMTVLASNKNYLVGNYESQLMFKDRSIDKSTLSTFNSFAFVVSIAKQETFSFMRYSLGYCNARGEVGTKNDSAQDKLLSLIRL